MNDPAKRPSWETYFMDIVCLIARRSTCIRRKVGAILVKNRQILASGYNGAPTQVAHCAQTGCLREKLNVPSGERHELCGEFTPNRMPSSRRHCTGFL